jgi:hypothetical protein
MRDPSKLSVSLRVAIGSEAHAAIFTANFSRFSGGMETYIVGISQSKPIYRKDVLNCLVLECCQGQPRVSAKS